MESKIITQIIKATEMEIEEIRHKADPLPLASQWKNSYHDGSAGCSQHQSVVFIETADGQLLQLGEVVGDQWSTNYAHQGGHDQEAEKTLGQAVTDRGLTPVAVYVAYDGNDSWSGRDDFAECSLTRHPWIEPDFIKIRRRLEDRLRKLNNNALLMQLAGLAGVKLD